MGQLPNENHSSPLTAEQSLRAAQQSYQKSGYQDDSALRAHFAQFPGANATAYAQQQAANQAQQNAQRAQAAQEAALADAAFRARQNRQGLLPAMASGAAKGFAEIGSDLATLPSVANQMSVDYMRRMIGNMNDAGNAAVTAGKTAYDLSLLPAKTVKAVTDAAKPVLLGSDQKTQAELDWEEFQRWKKNNKK